MCAQPLPRACLPRRCVRACAGRVCCHSTATAHSCSSAHSFWPSQSCTQWACIYMWLELHCTIAPYFTPSPLSGLSALWLLPSAWQRCSSVMTPAAPPLVGDPPCRDPWRPGRPGPCLLPASQRNQSSLSAGSSQRTARLRVPRKLTQASGFVHVMYSAAHR